MTRIIASQARRLANPIFEKINFLLPPNPVIMTCSSSMMRLAKIQTLPNIQKGSFVFSRPSKPSPRLPNFPIRRAHLSSNYRSNRLKHIQISMRNTCVLSGRHRLFFLNATKLKVGFKPISITSENSLEFRTARWKTKCQRRRDLPLQFSRRSGRSNPLSV